MTIKEVSTITGLSQETLRYYERIGMIPAVTRTRGGNRDYRDEDMRWVSLAKCMRSAGLPIEVMVEYVRLYQQGDKTIPARLELLRKQMAVLERQTQDIQETIRRLSYKISRYEEAMVSGELVWTQTEEGTEQ